MTSNFKLCIIPLLLLVLFACSGNTNGTGAVGSASFTLAWDNGSRAGVAKSVALGEICSANGIDQIKVSYVRGATVVQSQTFACSLGSGTVTGIPVGSYTLLVEGLTGGIVTWRGTISTVTIEANRTTDHGIVTMSFVGGTYTVTATADSNGSITPAGISTVTGGQTKTFIVTPNSGYSIASVTGCGGNLSGNSYTTGPITGACTVSASFSSDTYTVTATAGANGSITPPGASTVTRGQTKSFTVTPNSGYSIADVTGCGGSLSGNSYTTGPITAACTISASFSLIPPVTYTVTAATADSNGNISPLGDITVINGNTKNFTVTPNSGYSIASVTGCGGSLAGNTYTTGPITAACAVIANFSPIITSTKYTVTAIAGANGSITPFGDILVTSGQPTNFTISPNSGFVISSISGNCGGSVTGNIYTTGPITSACSVTANFSPAPTNSYSISGSITTQSGLGVPSLSISLTGTGTTLATTDFSGNYSFTNAVNGEYTLTPLLTQSAYTFSPISRFVTVKDANLPGQNFTAIPVAVVTSHTVSTSVPTGNGSLTPTSQAISNGGTANFNVITNNGYGLSGISGCGGTLSGSGSLYTTGQITGPCTVTASFSQLFTINTIITGGGTLSPTSKIVTSGSTATFAAIPISVDYFLTGISGCGGSAVQGPNGITFITGPITSDCVISASFSSATGAAFGFIDIFPLTLGKRKSIP
jgi:hypothetical protein